MANKLLLGVVIGVVIGAGGTFVLTRNDVGSSLGLMPPLKVEKFQIGAETLGNPISLRITNTGTDDIRIQDLAINDRDECSDPEIIGPLRKNGRILKVGEVFTSTMTCKGSLVRVTVKTDHGTGSYGWK
jgi:hypothetical protein